MSPVRRLKHHYRSPLELIVLDEHLGAIADLSRSSKAATLLRGAGPLRPIGSIYCCVILAYDNIRPLESLRLI